jgi:hypothetical protein
MKRRIFTGMKELIQHTARMCCEQHHIINHALKICKAVAGKVLNIQFKLVREMLLWNRLCYKCVHHY